MGNIVRPKAKTKFNELPPELIKQILLFIVSPIANFQRKLKSAFVVLHLNKYFLNMRYHEYIVAILNDDTLYIGKTPPYRLPTAVVTGVKMIIKPKCNITMEMFSGIPDFEIAGEHCPFFLKQLTADISSTDCQIKSLNFFVHCGSTDYIQLFDAVSTNKSLTRLSIRCNTIPHLELYKLPENITALNLSFSQIGDRVAMVIADVLKRNNLIKLDLLCNRIKNAGAIAIAGALMRNTSLTNLCLFDNIIGNAGATAIAQALKVNNNLMVLDLESNIISNYGAVHIAGMLMANTTLHSIYLRGNDIGNLGLLAIYYAVKVNIYLKHFRVSFDNATNHTISDNFCKLLKKKRIYS